MRGLVLAVMVILLSGSPSMAGTSHRHVSLGIQVFPCKPDSISPPSLRIADINSAFKRVPVSERWLRIDGTWLASLTVPEGHYVVSSESQHCSGESEQWIAVAGERRNLVITLNESKVAMLDENMYTGAVYGFLPTRIARVEIMSADSILGEQTRRAATIDGNIFQVGHLRPGRFVSAADQRVASNPRSPFAPTFFEPADFVRPFFTFASPGIRPISSNYEVQLTCLPPVLDSTALRASSRVKLTFQQDAVQVGPLTLCQYWYNLALWRKGFVGSARPSKTSGNSRRTSASLWAALFAKPKRAAELTTQDR